MQTKLSSEKLRQAINIANRFISLRPTLPVLANIKLESSKTKLRLVATNLENSIVIDIPAVGEGWTTTVPAKLLVEFLNLVKSEESLMEIKKETLDITAGEAHGVFNTIDASEFPNVSREEKGETTLSQKEIQQALASIVFSASIDQGKPVLNGILIRKTEKGTQLVATDSYRLAQYLLKESYNFPDTIVPARSFYEAVKIAGELGEEAIDIGVSVDNNQIFVSGGSFQSTARLIDGVYPAFEQIIPKTFVCEVLVEKEKIISAVKQAAVFARDTGNVVKLFLSQKGEIKVWASTKQIGEGTTKVEANVNGEDLEIAFNSRFFLEGIETVRGNTVKLNFAGSLKPAIVTGEEDKNFSYVVMPVKPQG